MEHRHWTEQEAMGLVLSLQPFGIELKDLLASNPPSPAGLPPGVAELARVRSCALCREIFEDLWYEELEAAREAGPRSPQVLALELTYLRRRSSPNTPTGVAASPSPDDLPCEITCNGEGVLLRIVEAGNGAALAVLYLTEGSPEGFVLRIDGEELEFGVSGVLHLERMPLRVAIERKPPRPGTIAEG